MIRLADAARCARAMCLAALTACAADKASPTDPFDDILANYPTDFEVSVSSGTTPTISWPVTNVSSLSIEDFYGNTLTQNTMWSFYNRNGRAIASPVNYGRLPSNADCGIEGTTEHCPNGKPLIKGRTYMLIVLTDDFRGGVKFFKP